MDEGTTFLIIIIGSVLFFTFLIILIAKKLTNSSKGLEFSYALVLKTHGYCSPEHIAILEELVKSMLKENGIDVLSIGVIHEYGSVFRANVETDDETIELKVIADERGSVKIQQGE